MCCATGRPIGAVPQVDADGGARHIRPAKEGVDGLEERLKASASRDPSALDVEVFNQRAAELTAARAEIARLTASVTAAIRLMKGLPRPTRRWTTQCVTQAPCAVRTPSPTTQPGWGLPERRCGINAPMGLNHGGALEAARPQGLQEAARPDMAVGKLWGPPNFRKLPSKTSTHTHTHTHTPVASPWIPNGFQ